MLLKFSSSNQNGIFTQLLQDHSSNIGCGASLYKKTKYNCLLLVCNYDYANFLNMPVYGTGNPAFGCVTGNNPQYPGLCSPTENVVPSPY